MSAPASFSTFTLPPTTLRDLTILTSAVRRLLGDFVGYTSELSSQESTLDTLVSSPSSDPIAVRKQREFISETASTIREISQKLREAQSKLEAFLDKHADGWRFPQCETETRMASKTNKTAEALLKAVEIINKTHKSVASRNTEDCKDNNTRAGATAAFAPTSSSLSSASNFSSSSSTDSKASDSSSPLSSLKYTLLGSTESPVYASLSRFLSSWGLSASSSPSLAHYVLLLPGADLAHLTDFLSVLVCITAAGAGGAAAASMVTLAAWKKPFEEMLDAVTAATGAGNAAKIMEKITFVEGEKDVEDLVKKGR